MSEFSMSRRGKRSNGLPSFLLYDLLKFCFFALSHPLYFSYFIFFSPYLFKVFSFLSPLFITTTLLLLAFITTLSPGFVKDDGDDDDDDELSQYKVGYLTFTYQTVLEKLRSKVEDNEEEFQHFEELNEVFKIVFDTSSTLESVGENIPADLLEEVVKETCLEAYETPVDKCSILEYNASESKKEDKEEEEEEDDDFIDFEKNPVEITQMEIKQPSLEAECTLKWCLEEEKVLENMSHKKEDTNKEEKEEVFTRMESKDIKVDTKVSTITTTNNSFAGLGDYNQNDQSNNMVEDQEEEDEEDDSQTMASNLGSFGSLRREKEWRRTLACKLFEERHHHNVDGGEGMDMLWETYEAESDKHVKATNKNTIKKGKKGVIEYNHEDDDDDDFDDETNGQLCCLQALKFSAGKMNLGMGRPNLLKISKALKGMGWLHHVTRHGKKRSN
ncbi:uncharacterized protein LOC133037492 [Cannabis sativa]|uniref:uncharacterized protein LOC133037492 n=1 Tax=Cannabis sativa TaxID=3483 RepID=UPI0029CA2A95|nr:uncharacterized protein LOC133037492 [Cannabis sativa]